MAAVFTIQQRSALLKALEGIDFADLPATMNLLFIIRDGTQIGGVPANYQEITNLIGFLATIKEAHDAKRQFVTAAEVAAALNKSISTIHKRVEDGSIPTYVEEFSSVRRIRREWLDGKLASQAKV